MDLGPEKILRNSPIPVEYAGLRGTTASMQSQGWQINIEVNRAYEFHGYQIRLFGNHPNQAMQFISYPFSLSIDACMLKSGILIPEWSPVQFYLLSPHLSLTVPMREMPIGKPINFGDMSCEDFNPDMQDRHISLQECMVFKSFNEEATIYVPEDKIWTMEEHLKAIKEIQAPFQKELREKKRKEANRAKAGDPSKNKATDVKLQLVGVS